MVLDAEFVVAGDIVVGRFVQADRNRYCNQRKQQERIEVVAVVIVSGVLTEHLLVFQDVYPSVAGRSHHLVLQVDYNLIVFWNMEASSAGFEKESFDLLVLLMLLPLHDPEPMDE